MIIRQRNIRARKKSHEPILYYSDKPGVVKSLWPGAWQWNNIYDHLQLHGNIPGMLMLTTYPPKECGIATFSQDLRNALQTMCRCSVSVKIAALEKGREKRIYPDEVKAILDTSSPDSYADLANYVNGDESIRAVVIQHEFGLFAEGCHNDFIRMIRRIDKPVSITFHTVLPSPSPDLEEKVRSISDEVDKVIVMTRTSADILQKDYDITKNKIAIIPHGTHLIKHGRRGAMKEKYGLKKRTVLSTFGLISRNKNIETTIKALKIIIEKHPDVIFLLLGRTHPGVIQEEGETYREELKKMVVEYGLQDHVRFVNRYLPLAELLEYLQLTDIYLFTSKDPNHAVSGTFSYAMSSGCGIVSAPIPHARELLSNGSGLLFDFEDEQSMAKQVLRYLNEPGLRDETSIRALQTIAGTAWENVGIKYASLFRELCPPGEGRLFQYNLPSLNSGHLEDMTDQIGIVQFTHINEPDKSSGYTLDDNARALIAAIMYYDQTQDKKMLKLIKKYFRFICHCRLNDCRFLNYMDSQGHFSEKNNHDLQDDANGRVIWALGFLLAHKDLVPASMAREAEMILDKAMPHFESLHSPRSIAFVMKGLYYYHRSHPSQNIVRSMENLAGKLISFYDNQSERRWRWFEPYLTYANSVIPEALMMSWLITDQIRHKEVAEESFDFLLSQIYGNGRIKVISNRGWLHKGQISHIYGEQPIDVTYTILALDTFFLASGNAAYLDKMRSAFNWFLGENHLQQIIYNPATGGCYDGLEEDGVNLNQGAESLVCYLMARLTLQRYEDIIDTLIGNRLSFNGQQQESFKGLMV